MDAEQYKQIKSWPVVNHFFDKLFHLRDMALTEPGRRCIAKRHETIFNLLANYFDEVNAPAIWRELLMQYK